MKTRFLQGPSLRVDVPQMKLGQYMMNNAQQGLELNEQKRQNVLNNQFKNKSFNQKVENDNRAYDLNVNKFDETKKQNKVTNGLQQKTYDLGLGKFNHQKKQNEINNGFKQQELNIKKNQTTAFKTPNEKALAAAGINPKSPEGQKVLKSMLYKKTLVPTVDKSGNTIMLPVTDFVHGGSSKNTEQGFNPIVKKTNDVDGKDVEDLNKAIEIANSISYAHDYYEPQYTGMVDDTFNWIYNKVGINNPQMKDYNTWIANLQSVANAARNKSFGAALSGFDIEEFAKEFPASNAGDGTVIPKLKVKMDNLNNALKNTYSLWVEKYGKERADSYFKGLNNKSFIAPSITTPQNTNTFSNEEIMNALKGAE